MNYTNEPETPSQAMRKATPYENVNGELQKSLDALLTEWAQLKSSLDPVLMPTGAKLVDNTKSDGAAESTVIFALRRYKDVLLQMTADVADIRSRIQI